MRLIFIIDSLDHSTIIAGVSGFCLVVLAFKMAKVNPWKYSARLLIIFNLP